MQNISVIVIVIYLLTSLCNSCSYAYYTHYNMLETQYTNYGLIGAVLPIVAYKCKFKHKYVVYVFVKLFAFVYMYIFYQTPSVYIFNSALHKIMECILKYTFYWKYICYVSTFTDIPHTFHMYGIASNISFFMTHKISHFIEYFNVSMNTHHVFVSVVCLAYLLLGTLVYLKYDVPEKHILMNEKINKKRCIYQMLAQYSASFIPYYISRNIEYTDVHYATIIASIFILSLNGKLLDYLSIYNAKNLTNFINIICIMLFLHISDPMVHKIIYVISISTKNIIFDSLHTLLHINHKKNVIDIYLSFELIATVLSYFTVYMISFAYQSIQIAFIACLILVEFCTEYKLHSYYIKDKEISECISNIIECELDNI